jgi:hypothetical protein
MVALASYYKPEIRTTASGQRGETARAPAQVSRLQPGRGVTRLRAALAGVDEDVHKSTLSLIDRKLAGSGRNADQLRIH